MKLQYRLVTGNDNSIIAVLELEGSVNSTTALEVGKAMTPILKEQASSIIVDLKKVNYISSAGWRLFLGRIRSDEKSLTVAGMQPTVRDVFELLDLGRVIQAFDTVESSIAALATQRISVTNLDLVPGGSPRG